MTGMTYLERCEWIVTRLLEIEDRSDTFVYFIEAVGIGRIKIGRAKNVQARLRALTTASPVELKLLGTMPGGSFREMNLHDRFRRFRICGEWFEDCSTIRDAIAEMTTACSPHAPPSLPVRRTGAADQTRMHSWSAAPFTAGAHGD